MSTYTILLCTEFQLADPKSKAAIKRLIKKHMDDYDLVLEPDGETLFTLEANDGEGSEVGDSYPERVGELVAAMGPYVKDAFCVTLRTDSMSDERDQVFFGGPSPEAIEDYRFKQHTEEALALFAGSDARHVAMRALLTDIAKSGQVPELVNPRDIRVCVDVSGGVVQNVYGSHPINLAVIDFDVEGATSPLTQLPGGDEAVVSCHAIVADRDDEFYEAVFAETDKHSVDRPRP